MSDLPCTGYTGRRPPRRRLLTLCSAVSLLLCVASIVMWVRGTRATDRISWSESDAAAARLRAITLTMGAGGLQFEHFSVDVLRLPYPFVGEPPHYRWATTATFWLPEWTRGESVEFEDALIYPGSWPLIGDVPFFGPRPQIFTDRQRDARYDNHWFGVVLPYWLTTVATALLSAARLVARVRGRWRKHHSGLCPTCGYDLRATPGRCPECGLEPAKVK